ncbi:hypothetical protein PG988_010483 [Apiospora saccharicola]
MTDRGLVKWLQMFLNKGPLELCYLAYNERKSVNMRLITQRGHPVEDESHQSDVIQRYKFLVHNIGRLAHHIRAPKQVIADAMRHRNIFDEGVTTVKRVSPVSSVPKPEPDGLTTPASILRRMVKPDHPRMREYQHGMEFLDRRLSIGEKIVDSYENKEFRPSVHCEVQVLEHFYDNNLRFSHNDRFVACSKPACYCCYLYFKAHPSYPEEPRSHLKIWPSWSPPLVPDGHRDRKYRHQLQILNSMIESIRKEALNQIENKVTDMGYQPDSTTGITPSDATDMPLEERMEILSIGHQQTDDEASESDSSLSTQSISSHSAHSIHETSATDTAPEEDDDHEASEPSVNRDLLATDDAAVGSAVDEPLGDTGTVPEDPIGDPTPESDDDDDDVEEGGAVL